MSDKIVIEDPEATADPWPKELLKGLNDMRSSSILCDVVINSNDNKYYSVHSAVLAAGSAFFCDILNQSKMSGAGIVVKLEKPSSQVEALISFLYTGQTGIDLEELDAFKQMAEGYGMTHLTKLCADKQYLLTLGNLVSKVTEGAEAVEVQMGKEQIEEPEMDGQIVMECETENAVIEDPDLEAEEVQMENLTRAIDIQPGIELPFRSGRRTNSKGKQRIVFECETGSQVLEEDPDLGAVEVQMDNLTRAINNRPRIELPAMRSARRSYNTGGVKKTWRDYKYSCPVCGKVFTSLSRMQGHQALHTGEKKHECNICGQKFIQIEYLREHVSIHSTNKPFKCDQCGMTFRLARHLKKHKKSHIKERKFECQLCHKLFKRNVGLLQHMTIHSGEKPYQCSHCERHFRHKEALHRHKRAVHTENCPFRCGFCNAGFSQLNGLKDHQNHCSMAKKICVLVCPHCDKTFQTSHTLNRHITLKHPGKPSNYKKVGEEEVQKAALRVKDFENEEDEGEHENEHEVDPEEVGGLLGQELVVDQDTSEIILQSLEKGIVLQEAGGLEIQTDEDGRMVYQVLTLQMGDDDSTAVLTTAPMMEGDEIDEITNENS